MVRLPLSEFFEYVRTELLKADKEARAAYSLSLVSKTGKRTEEQQREDHREAFIAARQVQLSAHQRLDKMLREHYLPLEDSFNEEALSQMPKEETSKL